MMKNQNILNSDPKDCPVCGLINPHSAERCDCGYDFTENTMKESYLKSGEISDDIKAMADLCSMEHYQLNIHVLTSHIFVDGISLVPLARFTVGISILHEQRVRLQLE